MPPAIPEVHQNKLNLLGLLPNNSEFATYLAGIDQHTAQGRRIRNITLGGADVALVVGLSTDGDGGEVLRRRVRNEVATQQTTREVKLVEEFEEIFTQEVGDRRNLLHL
jgi:hypothetical protein